MKMNIKKAFGLNVELKIVLSNGRFLFGKIQDEDENEVVLKNESRKALTTVRKDQIRSVFEVESREERMKK